MTDRPRMTPEQIAALTATMNASLARLKGILTPEAFDELTALAADARSLGESSRPYPFSVFAPEDGAPSIAEVVAHVGEPVWKHPFPIGDTVAWGFQSAKAREAFIARWGGVPRGKGVDFE